MSWRQQNISIGNILASLLFGIIGGVLTYKYMDYPLAYTEFIAGNITWDGEGKSKDISMIFGFMLVTSFSLFGISRLQGWIERQYGGETSNHFSIVLIYSTVPFVIWVGEQVLSKKIPAYDLLFYNAWIILGGLLATFFTLKSSHVKDIQNNFNLLIIFSFITFLFSAIAPNVISVALMKLGIVKQLKNAWLLIPVLWLVGLYLIKNKIKYYQYSIVFFQLLITGYFALLIPSPYITEGRTSFFPIQNSLYVVLSLLIALSMYDIYKRFKHHGNTNELSLSLLSPFPLAAILILIFFSASIMPHPKADDYHYGEKLLPFYMISKYHIIPYADYTLSHGFVDMFPAIGNSLFLDGTATTFYESNRIVKALIVVASFLIAYRYIGILTAFLLSMLLAPIGIWYFIAVLMSLIIMKVKAEKLGVSFFIISLILFLLAPGQGAIFIVSILPLALYRAWSTKTIVLNSKFTGLSFLFLIVAALVMPWILDMILAAVRFVLENGSVNFQAYGIAWHKSWTSNQTPNSSLAIFEIIRTSWVFIPIFILIFWFLGYYNDKEKTKAFFYGLFVVTFVLIMHKYSLGRIGSHNLSRLGVVSKMAIPLLFLSVYFLSFSKQKFACWTLFFTFWMGLLTPSYLHSPIYNAKRTISTMGALTNGNEIGIPKLGNGITNADHIGRILAVKNIADQFLDENETFVDVTNRSALYFYLNRRMPIEAAPYNQPHPNMQQRSIDRLSKSPPPMALLKADNKNFDGRTVSIRTHRLYRWIMDNYIPVVINNIIIGVHKNELDRFNQRFPTIKLPQSIEEQLVLWDKIFLLKNLLKLPISWGVSNKSLNERMKTVQGIESSGVDLNNVKAISLSQFQVTGKDPYVVYDISQYNLSGKEAGLLSFDFTCNNDEKPRMEVYWAADSSPITRKTVVSFYAHNGHIIVPLDAMPRWYSAKHLIKLRIDLHNKNDCKVFTIENLKLSQRI